jgi:membrane fusion protein (multidrug efflux system)
MKKRILFAVLGVAVVVAALAGVKTLQIRAMIDQGKKTVPPPDTVTTAAARSESWDTSLSAVGSLAAVQGVTVTAELSAKVVEIAFTPGAAVSRGDLLIRQDTSVEEAQLPGAEAQVSLARSVLSAMRAAEGEDRVPGEYTPPSPSTGGALVETWATIARRSACRSAPPGHPPEPCRPYRNCRDAASLDPIYVNFALPQQELSRLRAGLPVRVTSDALPGLAIDGRITTVNPQVDVDTRNVQLQATVSNPAEKLRPGMFVNASVGLPVRNKVVAIPATSVLYAPFGDSVFAVVSDPKGGGGKSLRQQFVRLGERRGDYVAVSEGLKEGDTVVSTGVFKLRNGQPVAVDNRLAPEFRLAPRPKND